MTEKEKIKEIDEIIKSLNDVDKFLIKCQKDRKDSDYCGYITANSRARIAVCDLTEYLKSMKHYLTY